MKTIVKILCVLICLLMALSAFSACKDKPEPSPDKPIDVDPTPEVDPTPKPDDMLDDIMQRKYPGKTVTGILYPEDLLALVDFVNSAGGSPALTENVVYYLAGDIDLNPGWSPAARVKNGKYLGTGAVPPNTFDGFDGFYGIFDGNGYTISGLYITGEMEEGDSLGFFKVLGGTVKDLTLANTFVEGTYMLDFYSTSLDIDGDFPTTLDESGNLPPVTSFLSASSALEDVNIGALAGKVVGDNVTIENLTVRANVVFRADESAAIGGVIGSLEADKLTATNVEFYGKAGLVASDNTYPAPATEVSIAQFIGDAQGNDVTLTGCVAGGTLICSKNAYGAEDFCAGENAGVDQIDCRVEATAEGDVADENVIEIYVAEDLLALWGDDDFEGKIVRLMGDINFNPDWSASAVQSSEEGKAPKRFWEGIPHFKGTFDGQGHSISGLCRVADASKYDYLGGFIDLIGEGAVVKNLTISNSALFIYSSSESEACIGGFAGKADGHATVDSVILELDVWNLTDTKLNSDIFLSDPDELVTVIASGNFGMNTKMDRALVTELFDKIDPYTGDGYDEEIIEIYTAEDLMKVMYDAQDGETFAGKTVRLMNNIDLNPGFNVGARLDSKTNRISFSGKPYYEWLGIPIFSGMFDGNGYSISGIYSWRNALSINNGEFGGFIDTARDGAIIKNLILKNSLHVVNNTGDAAWGSGNIHVGGLIARCDKTKDYKETFALSLFNVYVDMDVIILCSNHSSVGGILSFAVRHGEDYTSPYKFENVVFAGRIINTDYTKKVPFTSPKDQFAIGQIVSNTNWGSQHVVTNALAAGEIICGNTTGVYPLFGGNTNTSSGVKSTNILNGRLIDLPTTGFNAKTRAYDLSFDGSSWSYSADLGFYMPSSLMKMIQQSGNMEDLVKELDAPFIPSRTADKIHVKTAAQLIALAESGEDFKGKTIYLDNDIDFNPGWSAATRIVDGKVVFPEEPEVTWTAFANFKGIIDGQGHTIRGLYSKRTVTGAKGNYGGLIDTHSDGAVRNLAVVNSIHIVENPSGTPAVHDLRIGGLAGEVRKTQVKTADKGKNKYALGNSEHYGLRVNGFFTDMEVWLVSNSNALVGGLLGYINGNYTIQHLVYAGKVGNTNAMTGGSASYAASSGAKNLALGQIVGCNNWFTSAYLEDALVIGDIITGTTSSYIHTYVGADDKVGYRRCSDKLFATLPENFPEDAAWTLSDAGFMVPNSLVDRMTTIRPSLAIVGTTVTGITLKDEQDTVGLTYEDGAYYVTIPDGITTIAADAFIGLPNIVSVTIPETLTAIGESAFEGQKLLTSITLPNGFSIIGKSAFAGCTSLSTINFPMSLTSIGDYAFDGCTELQLNAIPRKVNYIGINAFRGCVNLTYLEFGYDQSVSLTIRNGAFDSLKTIRCTSKLLVGSVLPDFLRSSLTEIRIMSGHELEANMFKGYTALTTVRIPTITVIRASAFNGCTSLTTLEIPKSVTLIEEGAFRGLSALTAYTVEEGNQNYISIDGNLYTADGTKLLAYAAGKTDETFVLPKDLTAVGSYAFDAFESLTSITYQGDKADLTKNIEFSENAFGQPIAILCNDGLTCLTHTVVIDVEGKDATCTEDGLTPASHCSVCGEVLSTQTVIEALGHDYDDDGICTRCGDEKASDGLVYVSNGDGTCYVSSIGTCTDEDIVIPSKYDDETVVGIGAFAFANTAITSVKIPASVTSIGTGAFANCSALKITTDTVATGNTVYTATANGIFKDSGATLVRLSAHLTTYTLPKEVTAIEDYAFAGCVKLVTLNVNTSNPNYKASSGVLYTKDGTTLVASKNATPITVAAGTKYIANGAFYGCNKLKKVTIASTVESIGDYAFYGCSLLDSVVNNATDLKHVGTDAFTGTKIATPPTGSED